jgi:carboxypeptidase C (cathepsin A)
MQKLAWSFAVVAAISCAHPSLSSAAPSATAPAAAKPADAKPGDAKPGDKPDELKPEEKISKGAVTIGGRRIDYTAVAGTLVVHPKNAEDNPPEPEGGDRPERGERPERGDKGERPTPPAAAMSYVAYFATGKDSGHPIMFLYNGGPGSATVWLHMGAFGPRRVITAEDSHTAAAPYRLVDNAYSLLDASDLVFIDAPGTGFGKVVGKDKEKAFYGVDADADAFADFITQFLSKYGRWNSAKYLFGESYGTTRSAVLARVLEAEKQVDLNGVILLSQILCFDADPDGPEHNPGVDLPYELVLPTYAATAWYHKKLPGPPTSLESLIADAEKFAMTEYAAALAAGNTLDPAQRKAVLEKLHHFTGLPIAYLDKANLRVTGGEFEKNLQDDADLTTGRLDSRFSGPTMDPLSKEADYDPQSAAIAPAYVSAYNDYARKQLGIPADKVYKPFHQVFKFWSWKHDGPLGSFGLPTTTNVMPDLAAAMKYNPNLAVQLEAGYFDLATPFFQGVYEFQHLSLPAKLQGNLEMKFYQSGHMIYANEPSLRALHDNVAAFVKRTYNAKAK